MPWFTDGIDQTESAAIEGLLALADYSQVFNLLISRPWVVDGIDELEVNALQHFGNIANHDGELAQQVANLLWITVDARQPDLAALEGFLTVAASDSELARRITALPWIADDVTPAEIDAMRLLNQISGEDRTLSRRVIALSWVEDGITPAEKETLEYLSSIAEENAPLAMRFARLPWLDGGASQDQFSILQAVTDIGTKDAVVAERLISILWFSVSVTKHELSFVANLSRITEIDAGLARLLVNVPWLADGITEPESSVVEHIGYIANTDAAAAVQIVNMPFLATFEPPDASAVESLAGLAVSNEPTFHKVISRFNLRGGISDSWANVVAMLYGVSITNPTLIDALLDPNRVTREFQTIHTPLSRDIKLTIVRTEPGTKQSMDVLEHSVRSIEEFMGAPLPSNYVGLLFGEAVPEKAGGAHFGTHIAALPEYGVSDGSRQAEDAGHLIAHEVAHYYWNSRNTKWTWISEGAAEFLGSISENRRDGKLLGPTRSPCSNIDTIAKLERLNPDGDSDDFRCYYVLGERFFLDMYDALGDLTFRDGFRRLYLMSQEDDGDEYPGTKVGISHVQEAFRHNRAAVQTVIDRWYHGTASR